jgi:MFS superfamily sulfate permease-like transporter
VENLKLFLSDLPTHEGDYVLYRIIGIINFMNVKEHTEKIKTLCEHNPTTVVISFRYLHYIDLEAMHAIKHHINEICKEMKRRSYDGQLKHKIVITGLSRYNIDGI